MAERIEVTDFCAFLFAVCAVSRQTSDRRLDIAVATSCFMLEAEKGRNR